MTISYLMVGGGALNNEADNVYASLQDKAHYLQIIHGLALAMLQRKSLDELLWLIAQSTISQLGFKDCVIYLIDEQRHVLVQRAAYGPKSPEGQVIVDAIEVPIGSGIVGTVAQTGEPERIADTRLDDRYIVDDEARRSELAIPIIFDGKVIGVLDSEHADADFYTDEHIEIVMTIASMASSKIAAALTIEKLNATVNELEETRNALRAEERRYRDLYNCHPSMLFSVDTDGCIASTNEYACEQLGFEPPELKGKPFWQLFQSTDSRSARAEIDACREDLNAVHRFEGSMRHKQGDLSWLRVTARGLKFEGQEAPSVLIVAEDVTDTHALSKELEFHTSHDWLTGLYNRPEFERLVGEAIRQSRSGGADHALCFIDLDQFKAINDSCGHTAGDALLRHVAECFEKQVRRTDLVGRLGADQFGILMMDCTLCDAKNSAHMLLETLAEDDFHWNDRIFSVSAGVGIASLRIGDGSVDAVFSAADAACLSAKERGRNRVHVFRERDVELVRRRSETQWVSRINRALSENAFELHFQPVRSLSTPDSPPAHAEILLRMIDEDGSLITPEAFIATAERYRLSGRIDEWVVERALSMLSRLNDEQGVKRTWAINLSGPSVGDDKFLDFVVEKFEVSGVVPARICFEITETAAISNLVRARRFIDELRALGCRFALDDFGIGFSSLAYLKSLPADFVKIDGMFISDINEDPIARAMVTSINDISHLMGKKTIAEFVHSEEVLQSLSEIGVDYAQGNFVARPRPLG